MNTWGRALHFARRSEDRVALGLSCPSGGKLDRGRSVGETACFTDMEIPMNGRFQISLRWFFVFTFLVAAFLRWYPTIWPTPPIQIRQPVMGRLTSVNDDFDDPLTQSEFEYALLDRKHGDAILDQIKTLKSVTISLAETVVEPPRMIPLFESEMELRRCFYICDTTCVMKDGTQRRLKIRMEKNHFHSLDEMEDGPFGSSSSAV